MTVHEPKFYRLLYFAAQFQDMFGMETQHLPWTSINKIFGNNYSKYF